MDKSSNQRVLGYKKSTEISEEELGVVSGGAGPTHYHNFKATGTERCPDARYDVVLD